MQETLDSLRSELARRRPRRSSQGFPPELRERVAAFVREERATGVSTSALATRLGISRQALRTWLGESPVPRRPKVASQPERVLVPVRLVAEPHDEAPAAFVLTSPRGYSVDGLGLSELAELLERLG